jgi:uncharacterized membrane protein
MRHAERLLYHGAWITLTALIVLALSWELWLAPLRPGGSWIVLKAIPLAFALRGLLYRRRYTYQWVSLLVLAYVAEGVVRAWSDTGLSQLLAGIEIVLSVTLFACVTLSARLIRRQRA